MKKSRDFWGLVAAAFAVAAVVQELRKPVAERTWHGTVGDIVPYDFRKPTIDRFLASYWNPTGPLISPRVWGAGWVLNFGAVRQLFFGDQTTTPPELPASDA